MDKLLVSPSPEKTPEYIKAAMEMAEVLIDRFLTEEQNSAIVKIIQEVIRHRETRIENAEREAAGLRDSIVELLKNIQ